MTTPTTAADRLRELRAKTTRGRWIWWTSNSWRRLRTEVSASHTSSVLEPFVSRRDGHPDCIINQHDMDFIAAAHNDLPAVLAEMERMAEEIKAKDTLFHAINKDWRDLVAAKDAELERMRKALTEIETSCDSLPRSATRAGIEHIIRAALSGTGSGGA